MHGNKKIGIICAIAAACLCMGAAAVAGGSAQDPLISLSYIKETYLPGIEKKADSALGTAYNALFERAAAKAERKKIEKIADFYIAAAGQSTGGQSFTDLRLYKGDKIKLDLGAKVVLKSGSAKLGAAAGAEYIDISAGAAVKSGAARANREYMATDKSCFVEAADYYTSVSVKGGYSVARAYTAKNEKLADGLKAMGLFIGTGSGYELERPATRIEAAVMLIRLLGEESDALKCTEKNPFADVPQWADRYAAYAYAKGYTKGTSADKFSPSAEVTDEQYFTFVMRALGYSDSAGEFSWDKASEFAVKCGVVTAAEAAEFKKAEFRRDQTVYISRNALYGKVKGGQQRLIDRLVSGGAVSSENFKKAERISGFAK